MRTPFIPLLLGKLTFSGTMARREVKPGAPLQGSFNQCCAATEELVPTRYCFMRPRRRPEWRRVSEQASPRRASGAQAALGDPLE